MVVIDPDFTRRIDLPGVGPCPRPVDVDQARTGFSSLVSLRVYAFGQGMVIDGDAEADEVFIAAMRGQAEMTVTSMGGSPVTVPLRQHGGMRVVYMPPHASYRLTALTGCDVAYARVAAVGAIFPPARGFTMDAEWLDIADFALGMDLTIAKVAAGAPIGFGQADRLFERFVHVRADQSWRATIAGETIGDWDTVTLAEGEDAVLHIETGTAELLTISASRRVGGVSQVAMNA